MTNIELRMAKDRLEATLSLSMRSVVKKFQEETGLRVTSVDVQTLSYDSFGQSAETFISSVTVRAEV